MGQSSLSPSPVQLFHLVRLDLSKEGRMSSTVCYKCNRTGHFARECSQGGSSDGRQGGFGGPRGGRGGGSGGPRGGSGGGGFGRGESSCYNCNKPGHIASECPESGAKTCYNCGKNGHISRDCPDGGSGGGDSRDSRKCYACGGIGHIS